MLLSNKTLTTALISVVAFAAESQSEAESTGTSPYYDDYDYGDDDYYGDGDLYGDDYGDSLDLYDGPGDAYDSYDSYDGIYADNVYGGGDDDDIGAGDYYSDDIVDGDDIGGGDDSSVQYYSGGVQPSAGDDKKDDDDDFRGRDYSDYLRGFKAFEPRVSDLQRKGDYSRPKTPFRPKLRCGGPTERGRLQ